MKIPIYNFLCIDCKNEYEELTKKDPEGIYLDVVCPSCGSDKKEKQVSNFSFAFSNPVGTDRWENSHEYRYKHKAPTVAGERENAAAKSHMGSEPYSNIDDITSGNHFGEVR